MIEVVYKEEKKEAVGNEGFFHIPKNIRQIGEISPAHKIYMEDYAHTFLVRIAEHRPEARIGLLLGRSNWAAGITYIFIKSALQIEGMEVSPEHIVFTDDIWRQADEKIKEYFPGQEVVGWFFIMPECTMELTDVLYRTHLNYFGGNDKLLYMMEPLEKEEAFFQYENGCMSRQKGFYLYYDKNKPMQEYMIEMNRNIPIENKDMVKDKAVQDFRKIIAGKPAKEESRNEGFSLLHAVSVCVVIGAIAVGATYLDLDGHQKPEKSSVEAGQIKGDRSSADRTTPTDAVSENEAGTATATPIPESPTESAGEKEIGADKEIQEGEKRQGEQGAGQAEQERRAEDAVSQEQALTANGSYVVQNGDTLSKISKRIYGNTSQIKNICSLNELELDDIIYPGQIILLP